MKHPIWVWNQDSFALCWQGRDCTHKAGRSGGLWLWSSNMSQAAFAVCTSLAARRSVLHVRACDKIPPGATPAPPQSWLCDRLSSMKFGYESEQLAPGCTRYVCEYGHLVTVRAGSPACAACPICNFCGANRSRKKLCIPKLSQVAVQRQGLLLSTKYLNAHQKLLWQCKFGHQWMASADNVVRRQSWCPECAAINRRLTIQDMRELAKRMGGECLSTEYISDSTKLKWRCAFGHTFEMAPNNIRRKADGKRKPSWCKICRKMGIPLPQLHKVSTA